MKHTTKSVLAEYGKTSNGIGFHIWEYASPDEIKMAREIAKLRNELEKQERERVDERKTLRGIIARRKIVVRPWERMTGPPG
jgi:hypothetical protein